MMNTIIPMNTLDQVFNSFFTPGRCRTEGSAAQGSRLPAASVYEGEKAYRIDLDMPGVERENIEISVEHQVLSIKATRESDAPEGFQSRRREYHKSLVLQRSFNLGPEVDTENIDAALSNGVLKLTLKKTQQALPRRIDIS